MKTWLFALVVLGFGVLLAYLLDRMRLYRKNGRFDAQAGQRRRERNRWLTYWFSGRFPTREEERELEQETEEEEARERGEKRDRGSKS